MPCHHRATAGKEIGGTTRLVPPSHAPSFSCPASASAHQNSRRRRSTRRLWRRSLAGCSEGWRRAKLPRATATRQSHDGGVGRLDGWLRLATFAALGARVRGESEHGVSTNLLREGLSAIASSFTRWALFWRGVWVAVHSDSRWNGTAPFAPRDSSNQGQKKYVAG